MLFWSPFYRLLCSLKWAVSVILALFQECLDDGCSLSTLKVHVAAIVAHHALIAACSICKNYLIIRFPTDVRSSYPSFRAEDVISDFLPHLGNNKMLIWCVWFRIYTFTLSALATFTTLFTQKLLFFSAFIHPHSVVPVQTWMMVCFLWNTKWDFSVMHFSILLFPMQYSDRSFQASQKHPNSFSFIISKTAAKIFFWNSPFVFQRRKSCWTAWGWIIMTEF